MVGRKRAPVDETQKPLPQNPGQADFNEIVAYNFRQARELRGWTQDEAAIALEPLLASGSPKRASQLSSGPTRAIGAESSMPRRSSPSPWRSTCRWCGSSSRRLATIARSSARPISSASFMASSLGARTSSDLFTTAFVSSASMSLTKLTRQSRTSQETQAQRPRDGYRAAAQGDAPRPSRPVQRRRRSRRRRDGRLFRPPSPSWRPRFVAERLDDPDYVYRPRRTKKQSRTTRD